VFPGFFVSNSSYSLLLYSSNLLLNVGILSTTQDNGAVGEMRMNESIVKG
jgi:hypothetical protein